MLNFVYVFLGGGLGSLCRYGIARWMTNHRLDFPLATFTANVLACLVLGYLVSLKANNNVAAHWQLVFMTGFCGGFSTFSTFTAETFVLFEEGMSIMGLLYVAASLLVCLGSLYLGIRMGSMF